VYTTAKCGVGSLAHDLAVRRHSMPIRECPPRVASLIGENHSPASRPTTGEAMHTTLEGTKG
jgi:hypothetical protein